MTQSVHILGFHKTRMLKVTSGGYLLGGIKACAKALCLPNKLNAVVETFGDQFVDPQKWKNMLFRCPYQRVLFVVFHSAFCSSGSPQQIRTLFKTCATPGADSHGVGMNKWQNKLCR